MDKTERFYTLDAMRGIAAILVVIYHMNGFVFNFSPGGYLAVDFFFALSGFVLAKAYEQPLKSGMSSILFIRARLIRLYPLFIIGVAISLITEISKALSTDPSAPTLHSIAASLALELFMLPSPFMNAALFPLNGPAWSLFFELVINCVFAGILWKLRSIWLYAICVISGAILAYATIHYNNLNIGWSWMTGWAGFARVTFSFCAGMIIARQEIFTKKQSVFFLIPIFMLIFPMIIPINESARPFYDIICALFLFPLILRLGATIHPLSRLRGACTFLGNISYPIYAVHSSIVSIAGVRAKRFSVPDIIWVPALIAFLIFLAWFLGKYVDPRLRRFMDRTLPKPAIRAKFHP